MNMGKVLLILAVSLVGIFFLSKAGSGGTSVQCRDCNIVIIDIDPFRADGLSGLGNPRPTTPFLDSLAKEGFLFTNAFAVSSWTLPSAMSLMTGVNPGDHRIINKELIDSKLNTTVPASLASASGQLRTLAEILKARGYVTGGFAGGAALSRGYGFDRGFDEYYSEGNFEGLGSVMPKAMEFLKKNKDQKYFLFLHGFDVHGQYVPPEGYDRRFVPKEYDGTVTGSAEQQKSFREEGVVNGNVFLSPDDVSALRAYYDEKAARLDETLKQFFHDASPYIDQKKTIVIVTSDHGEEFYEHGRIDHGMTLFDEVLHIPLIITIPGIKSRTITSQVRNIDLLPTIADITGQPVPDEMESVLRGTSLVPLLMGNPLELDLYAETSYRYATFQKALRRSDGWKLIYDAEFETKKLFDTARDPGETIDRFGKGDNSESALVTDLVRFLDGTRK